MSHRSRQVRIVDVFTSKALAGNQLAVILDGRGMSTELMQKIAREMNFSETTFIFPPDDPSHAARVRIFTPDVEMRFAGHPTIGTAWVMHDGGLVESAEFVLEEGVGPVKVRSVDGVWWMTHPPVEFGAVFPHSRVASAIGLSESDLIDEVPAQVVTTGTPFLFVAVRDKAAVDAVRVEGPKLQSLLHKEAIALFVFAASGRRELYSRCVGVEIAEDPATGSASGPLGAFAVRYGLIARSAKVSITSEQGKKMGRQSFVHIELEYADGADIPSRTEVGGSVMPVLSGTLSDFGE